MAKSYMSTSGFDATTAIGKFYNRDEENEVGFEMRMTAHEYHELSRFIEQVHKDGIERGRQAMAAAVTQAVRFAVNGFEKP